MPHIRKNTLEFPEQANVSVCYFRLYPHLHGDDEKKIKGRGGYYQPRQIFVYEAPRDRSYPLLIPKLGL